METFVILALARMVVLTRLLNLLAENKFPNKKAIFVLDLGLFVQI